MKIWKDSSLAKGYIKTSFASTVYAPFHILMKEMKKEIKKEIIIITIIIII